MVHNRGMQRWVSMRLASLLGVWANCRYPFPNELVHELFRAAFTDIPEKDPYRKEIMTWRIMELVPDCTGLPGFEPIREYLGDTGSPMRRFQLSREIADSFDQYLTYRHEMVLSWEGGYEDHWQAELWRRVRGSIPTGTRLRSTGIIARLRGDGGQIKGLPERISVLGYRTSRRSTLIFCARFRSASRCTSLS
jgi:exodeoxyribonuclease V gamma subunit